MLARIPKLAFACTMLVGCAAVAPGADGLHDIVPELPAESLQVAPIEDRRQVEAERFRFVEEIDQGLSSVLLVPTAVEEFVAVGPMARSRLFLGALFATQRLGGDRVSGVGLVIKSVGGGLGPALAVAPFVTLTVDGERLLVREVARGGLYRVEPGPWGLEETLTFRVPPRMVEAMSDAAEVQVQVGDRIMFVVGERHRIDLRDFLDQIPAGTRFDVHPELTVHGAKKTE